MSIYACNNCAWVGHEGETVHPKHAESISLCPNCKETTEEVTPSWFNEIREEAKHKDSESKKAISWLIKIYIACGRKGWEEGPTEGEVMDNILSFLGNRDLIPKTEEYADNVKKLLSEVEPDPF